MTLRLWRLPSFISNLFANIYYCSFFFYQDFDQDDYIGKEDLKQTLRAITANELTDEEMEFVSDKVLILKNIC